LYAEGCAVLGVVQPYFAGESPCTEFHRPSRRNYRGNLLSIYWSGVVPFVCNPAWFWVRKTVLSRFAGRAAVGLDCSVCHFGCLLAARAAVSFAGLACRLQHPGARRGERIG